MLLRRRRLQVGRLGTASRSHSGHRSVVDVDTVRKSALAAQHMRDLMESDGGSRRVLAFSARGPHQSFLQQTMDAGLAFYELERRGHSLMSVHDWCQQVLIETGHEQRVVGFGKLVALLLMHTKDIPLERLHRVTSSMQMRKIAMDLVRYFQLLETQGVTPAAFAAFANSSGGDSLELQMQRVAHMELANAYRVYQELLTKCSVTSWDGLVLEMLTKVNQPSLPDTTEFLNVVIRGFTDLVADDLQAMTPAMVKLLAHLSGSPLIQSSASFSHVLQPTDECPRTQFLEHMLDKHYSITTSKSVVDDVKEEMLKGPALEIRRTALKILDRSKNDSIPTSPAITCVEFSTVTDEEQFVVQEISDRLKSHPSPQEIAVLCATYADAERMTQCLRGQNIPVSNRSYGFATKSGNHLFDEPGVNTIVSLLVALCFPSDSAHFYNVLRSDSFDFPPLLLSNIMEREHRTHASLFEVLETFVEHNQNGIEANHADVQKATKFVELMKRLRSECHQSTSQEIVQVFLEETGRLAMLLNPSTPELEKEAVAVADFLRELEITQRVTQSPHIPFVVPYLLQLRETHVHARTMEASSTDDVADANDAVGVRVLPLVPDSLHSLSVACLFMVSMRDSQFPGRLKRHTLPLPYSILHAPHPVQTREEHLQNCERLGFQALTCAREQVMISYTKFSSQGKSSRQEKPSRIFASIWQTHDPKGGNAGCREDSSLPKFLSETPVISDPIIPYDPKHLSYSQITEYQRCPQRYFLSRVMKLSSEASTAMIYGRALHEAIACFAGALLEKQNGKLDMKIAEQNAHAVLLNALTNDGQFRSEEHRDAVLNQSRLALDAFMRSQQDAEVLHVEHSFQCEVPEANVMLRGIWDRIDQGPIGPVIQEFKSNLGGAKRDVRKAAAESLQLKLYMYAYERVFGRAPHGATLQIIGEHDKSSKQSDGFVPYTPTIAQEVVSTIQEVATAMRNGKFKPTPSYMECMFCPFATSACRAGKDVTLKAENALE